MFQLESTTAVDCISVIARPEFHGDEKVSAISWRFRLKGENTLLDLIEPGLRRHHYHNAAAEAGQIDLMSPEAANLPLPNLRYPKLPTTYAYGGGEFRSRGYRWMWDWGTEESHADFTDAVLSKITYEIQEGGSVSIEFSVSYNGDELSDDALYGELCKLSAKGQVYIRLLAPPELMAVKKGYRAGKPDTPAKPPKDPAQQEFENTGDDTEDDVLTEGSPEAALAATEGKGTVH